MDLHRQLGCFVVWGVVFFWVVVTGGLFFPLFRGLDMSLCLPVWLAGVFVVRVGAGSRQAHFAVDCLGSRRLGSARTLLLILVINVTCIYI